MSESACSHKDDRNWKDGGKDDRGWTRVVCKVCGGFIGYRPPAKGVSAD